MLTFLARNWFWLLVAFITIDLLLVLYVFCRRSQRRLSGSDRAYLQKQWRLLTAEVDSHPRQAVLEADKLVDVALQRLGYHGPLGEKLKQAAAHFSDLRGLWRAHLLRNRLAHELEVRLTTKETEQALRAFHHALRDLGL